MTCRDRCQQQDNQVCLLKWAVFLLGMSILSEYDNTVSHQLANSASVTSIKSTHGNYFLPGTYTSIASLDWAALSS